MRSTRAITVPYSTGAAHLQDALRRDDTPLFPSLRDLLKDNDIHNRTLFTVVDDNALVERLIVVAQASVGDFDSANIGILFTVPVDSCWVGAAALMERSVIQTGCVAEGCLKFLAELSHLAGFGYQINDAYSASTCSTTTPFA